MDAASQLRHYSQSNPPTPLDPPKPDVPTGGINQETPGSTMTDNTWPAPPVTVNATPPPITPAVMNSQAVSPLSTVVPSNGDSQNKPQMQDYSIVTNSHHFPLMIVTMLVIVALVGFGGSFLYFKSKGASQNTAIAPLITPPVTIVETQQNDDQSTAKADEANPFAQSVATVSSNPFAQDEEVNPFENVSDVESATGAAYQNPFETTQ